MTRFYVHEEHELQRRVFYLYFDWAKNPAWKSRFWLNKIKGIDFKTDITIWCFFKSLKDLDEIYKFVYANLTLHRARFWWFLWILNNLELARFRKQVYIKELCCKEFRPQFAECLFSIAKQGKQKGFQITIWRSYNLFLLTRKEDVEKQQRITSARSQFRRHNLKNYVDKCSSPKVRSLHYFS